MVRTPFLVNAQSNGRIVGLDDLEHEFTVTQCHALVVENRHAQRNVFTRYIGRTIDVESEYTPGKVLRNSLVQAIDC